MKVLTLSALLSVALGVASAHAGDILRSKALGDLRSDRARGFADVIPEGQGLFLVQWKNAPREAEKAEVSSLGLRLLSYFPDDAFLAQGEGSAAQNARQLSYLQLVIPYTSAMKVERGLAPQGILSKGNRFQVSVQLVPGADPSQVRGALKGSMEMGSGIVIGNASASAIYEIAALPEVIWVEKYLPLRSMDLKPMELGVRPGVFAGTPTGYESGVKILNAASFHALGLTGQGQVVAVADTGLDTGDVSTLNADFQGPFKKGLAMGLGGKSWGDPMMHGTHVSGSILGTGKNSNGLIQGAAYGAQLVMEGMWSDIMNNIVPPSLDKLFDAAYSNGARIHSNSWGSPNSAGRYDNWAQLTDTWAFNHPDYLLMFAAGNDGADLNKDGVIDEGTVGSPGTAKNVLTVGASKNLLNAGGIQRMMKELRGGGDKWGVEPIASSRLSEDSLGMAAFSSRGPTADGRIKPELVAPGTNIVSVRDKHPKADPATMSWGVYDDNYVFMGGTSMATPVAAGGVALIRQLLVQKSGKEDISAALLKAVVANSAEDLYPGQFGLRSSGQEQPTVRPNNHEGWGRLNLANLVGSRKLEFYDEKVGLSTGQSKEVKFNHAGGTLRITMAYTDAPGTAGAAKVLVNDLDLLVRDASGREYYPNNRSTKDSINNMEQIDIASAESGSFTITVTGASVPQGKNGAQPYALVISAGN